MACTGRDGPPSTDPTDATFPQLTTATPTHQTPLGPSSRRAVRQGVVHQRKQQENPGPVPGWRIIQACEWKWLIDRFTTRRIAKHKGRISGLEM